MCKCGAHFFRVSCFRRAAPRLIKYTISRFSARARVRGYVPRSANNFAVIRRPSGGKKTAKSYRRKSIGFGFPNCPALQARWCGKRDGIRAAIARRCSPRNAFIPYVQRRKTLEWRTPKKKKKEKTGKTKYIDATARASDRHPSTHVALDFWPRFSRVFSCVVL